MNEDIIIGAITTNYSVEDVKPWVISSKFKNVTRVLLICKRRSETENQFRDSCQKYRDLYDKSLLIVTYDFLNVIESTGNVNRTNSDQLIHNVRFALISDWLTTKAAENVRQVIITDVKDVFFTRNPFLEDSFRTRSSEIVAVSEKILYKEDSWNHRHILDFTSGGLLRTTFLQDCEVVCVGVLGGRKETVADVCESIYTLAKNKDLVADQTAFNYMVRKGFIPVDVLDPVQSNFAIHLHVIANGSAPVELTDSEILEKAIIHQYDRMPKLKAKLLNEI